MIYFEIIRVLDNQKQNTVTSLHISTISLKKRNTIAKSKIVFYFCKEYLKSLLNSLWTDILVKIR